MEPQVPGLLAVFAGFIPALLFQIPYAIFAGALAKRLNGNTAVWVIVSLIPLVGFIFLLYVFYRVIATVLDRLNEINSKVAF